MGKEISYLGLEKAGKSKEFSWGQSVGTLLQLGKPLYQVFTIDFSWLLLI